MSAVVLIMELSAAPPVPSPDCCTGAQPQFVCAAWLQVTGVLATRETFMVSIYDYNRDAEEAEKAEQDAAAPLAMSPAASPASAAIKRNLSGGVTVKSRPCQSAAAQSKRAAMQWALPAWGLVAVLVLVLVRERREHLQSLPWLRRYSRARLWQGSLGGSKAPVLKQ